MSNQHGYTDDVQVYPRQPRDTPPQPSRRTTVIKTALAATVVLATLGLVAGAGVVLLRGLDPMGDEWVCSDGEAPGGVGGHYNQCYPTDSPLPAGIRWDPFGNRPMPYNCDKDGWVLIERPVTRRGVADTEQDCVREDTELPGRWHVVED